MSGDLANLGNEIAREILSQGILVTWPYFALLLAFCFLAGLAGSFVRSYGSKRGETLATKADFDLVLEQLRKSTRAAEETRAEVEAAFGEASERRKLLREKIEEFLVKCNALDQWHDQLRSAAFRGQILESGSSPLASIRMLQALYFKELSEEVAVIVVASNDLIIWCGRFVQAYLQAQRQSGPAPQPEMDELKALIGRLSAAQRSASDKLVESYGPRAGL